MDQIYKCDFCLELFSEKQVEKCFHCHKRFCEHCIKPCRVIFEKESGEIMLVMKYCTNDCRMAGGGFPHFE